MKPHRTPQWILDTKPIRKHDHLSTMLIAALILFLAVALTFAIISLNN